MDMTKLQNQLNRRMEKLDLSLAAKSNRKPLEDYTHCFFTAEVPFSDSVVKAKVILCTERVNGTFKGIYLDTKGPWILFKVLDIVSGDPNAKISIGTTVLAKWNTKSKVYDNFISIENPTEYSTEVEAIASLVPATEYEIVTGKAEI